MPKSSHKDRVYHIVPTDPAWAERYQLLENQFIQIFDDCQPDIHHVGGTAIEGLPSQPIVDVLVVVPDIHCLDRELTTLKQFGYEIEFDYVGPETVLVSKEKDNVRIENIHILPQGHKLIDSFLIVKTYWEAHPEKVSEYGEKKLELYAEYPKSYDKYREHRDDWLEKFKKKEILPWFKTLNK